MLSKHQYFPRHNLRHRSSRAKVRVWFVCAVPVLVIKIDWSCNYSQAAPRRGGFLTDYVVRNGCYTYWVKVILVELKQVFAEP